MSGDLVFFTPSPATNNTRSFFLNKVRCMKLCKKAFVFMNFAADSTMTADACSSSSVNPSAAELVQSTTNYTIRLASTTFDYQIVPGQG